MKVQTTSLDGVLILEPAVFADARGFFFESFNAKVFRDATGIEPHFVQDNQSHSSRNVLRGIDYQVVRPQGKLVRVVTGRVFDAAVDLRKSSPTFGKAFTRELSGDEPIGLYIPAGFAHGFIALTDDVLFMNATNTVWNGPADGGSVPSRSGRARLRSGTRLADGRQVS